MYSPHYVLPMQYLPTQLLRELEETSADSGSLAEAAFWRVQEEVLAKQQQLWQQQQAADAKGGKGDSGGKEGRTAPEA